MKNRWIAVVAIPILLFGATYWGYLRGIESQAVLEAPYIVVIQGLAECHENRDWECVQVTNEMMSTMFASKMGVLIEKSMIDESIRGEVEAFLEWHEATWAD